MSHNKFVRNKQRGCYNQWMAQYPQNVAHLPAPPPYLPTSQITPVPGDLPQLTDFLAKPMRAASPYDIDRRYTNIRRALIVELGGLATFALVLTIVMVGIGTATSGALGLVALLAGLLPLPVLIAFGLWVDRHEPEPPWLLARAFLWGAGASIVMAGFFNEVIGALLGSFVMAVVGAPFIEEFLKGMAIWWVFKQRSEHVHGIKDAIVYAIFVGIGFTIVEDIVYYLNAVAENDNNVLFGTIAFRGLVTPLLHSFFSVFVAIGIAKRFAGADRFTLVKWYFLAVFLHGLWNSGIGMILYPVVYLPLFIWGIVKLKKHGKLESMILTQGIAAEVQTGLITREQLDGIYKKTTLGEFIKSLLSTSHEIHLRRHMQSAAWSLASHRQAVIIRYNAGYAASHLDRSADDYLRLFLEIRAREWSAVLKVVHGQTNK